MANGDGLNFQGLLGDPAFNLGVGLLGSGLSRPRSFGEGLLSGFQAGGELQGAALANFTARERLRELSRQRQRGSAVRDLIESLGPQAGFGRALDLTAQAGGQPGPTRQAAALGERLAANAPLSGPQSRAIGLLAEADPSAALTALTQRGGLLGAQEPQSFSSPIGKLLGDLELARTSGNDFAVNAIETAIKQQGGGDVDIDDIRSVRNDVLRNSRTFLEEAAAFDRVQAASGSPSPAGDLSLVFSFMKLLDPGSTVREGEFSTAQNSASVPERVRGLYNRLVRGERLTEEQRRDFLSQARAQFDQARNRQQRLIDDARGFANRQGFAIEDIIPEYVIPRSIPSVEIGEPEVVDGPIDLGGGVVGEWLD